MTTGLIIRPAVAGDIPEIEHIVAAAYEPYVERIGRAPAPMGADYRALVAHTDHVQVALHAGRIVGLLVLVPQPDHLLIENVAVAPEAQGHGFGRMLVAHAESAARQLGHAEVRLYTNAAMVENLSLYEHLGYVETGRRREAGFDRVYLTKPLT